ncbi:MAG: type I DNA topoisomerase [Mycoplasmatales bacterium]
MKKLVIVESPSKAKTIEKYLGKDYIVTSSVGHVRDLAIKGEGGFGVDIEADYTPTYTYIKGKKKVVTDIKKQAKECDQIYLATDPDREGEAISWHLADELGLDLTENNRIIFNEITKNGVLKGIQESRKLDMDLVYSQESRRIIDRIMGFKLSNLLQKKIKAKSAGRVQSVALRLIVEREEEIRAFIPVEYAKLFADYETLELEYEKNSKKVAPEIIAEIYQQIKNDKKLVVDSITPKTSKQNSKHVFTTSTLQQTASTKLGFGSKKTMSLAQKLYEGLEINGELEGLITYMRTDSTRMSEDFVKNALGYINNVYGKEYVGFYRLKKEKGNIQDAHEGIRPTNLKHTPSAIKRFLTPEQFRLYELIWNRAIASLMKAAEIETTTYLFKHQQGTLFKTTASKILFDGYRKIYLDENETEEKIIDFSLIPGQEITVKDYRQTNHFTTPPSRFSEAKLIKEMEENGIGRPSTYAATIDILKTRNYVTLENKAFTPTEIGELVVNKLKEFFEELINVEYTSKLEEKLDLIAVGESERVKVIDAFYHDFIEKFEEASKGMETLAPEFLDEECPNCGKQLVKRRGKYGDFVACSGFPECKFIQNENTETFGTCPKCNEGQMVEKRTKRGKVFYGCDRFPKCDQAVWKLEDIGIVQETEPKKKKVTKKKTTKSTTKKPTKTAAKKTVKKAE